MGEGYENPAIPEGINAPDEHPLKEFAWLSFGALIIVIALVWLIAGLGYLAGSLIPFETETRIMEAIESLDAPSAPLSLREQKLNDLAQKLIAADPLPQGMSVVLREIEAREPNAFATLGGRVYVTTGLLDMPLSENALAMALAHEIAHIRARHVISSLSRGLLMSLTMNALFGAQESSIASSMIGQAGVTTELTFSRSDEEEADRLALKTLYNCYGHIADATAFFEAVAAENGLAVEFLSTHPDLRKRVEAIGKRAKENGWPTQGEITPSPFR